MNYIIVTILLIIGAIDVLLVFTRQRTISQAIQKLFPTWVDMIIFVVGLVGLCVLHYYRLELDFTLSVIMAGFWGHIWFPNQERYGE